MKLSIIIPVYNAEKYIKRCMESLVKQLDEEDELIVVDDGSTDNSGVICDEYKKYKQVNIIHQQNSGEGPARNTGIKAATGDYLTFVDADDFADESMVSIIKRYADEKSDVILFDYIEADGNKSDESKIVQNPKEYVFGKDYRDQFIKCNFLAQSIVAGRRVNMRAVWSKVYNKAFLLDNNLLFDNGVKIGVDMLYTLKVFDKFENAKYVGLPIYHYFFQNVDSITNRYKPDFQDIVNSYINKIEPWLRGHEKYRKYHAAYRLNDIILYIKYDFFHEENVETKKILKKRMDDILKNGVYQGYYQIAKKTGLMKTYSLTKRITFWCAIHNIYPLLKLIYFIKYKRFRSK